MDPREISLIVFACVFCSALLGFFLGNALPDRHLDNNAKDIVKQRESLFWQADEGRVRSFAGFGEYADMEIW